VVKVELNVKNTGEHEWWVYEEGAAERKLGCALVAV
jgi:hypothetical protein